MNGSMMRTQDVPDPPAPPPSGGEAVVVPEVDVEPEVVVPADLVGLLTQDDPGLLTQPVATLIAAGIALVAAGIAWSGVKRQIRANNSNTNRQLATQRFLHRESQKAEVKKQLRADRLEALVEAAGALQEGLLVVIGLDHEVSAQKSGARMWSAADGYVSNRGRRAVAQVRLRLLGLDESHDELRKVNALFDGDLLTELGSMTEPQRKELHQAVDGACQVFKTDLHME
ncbi:hypothetical protein TVH25_19445 [Rhodococcus sp. 7Tela_A2]|uniref:hypothetical protein n=1 Tax=Rhodococcus sp. 7Tela_A2 TaxID=3093744 RepID=UPI003BB77B82